MKTRDQQRADVHRRAELSVRLELSLRNLIRKALAGDTNSMVDFQSQMQFAPPEMRDSIMGFMRSLENRHTMTDAR